MPKSPKRGCVGAPLVVVHQRPVEVALHRHAGGHGCRHGPEVLTDVAGPVPSRRRGARSRRAPGGHPVLHHPERAAPAAGPTRRRTRTQPVGLDSTSQMAASDRPVERAGAGRPGGPARAGHGWPRGRTSRRTGAEGVGARRGVHGLHHPARRAPAGGRAQTRPERAPDPLCSWCRRDRRRRRTDGCTTPRRGCGGNAASCRTRRSSM